MAWQSCPICGGTRLMTFLQRKTVPVHQNLLVSTDKAARAVTRGDLDFVACESCGFVFNRAFDASLLEYGQDYDNTQSCSAHFDGYMNGLVETLVQRCGVRHCTIVEVGCGKGHFLRKLVQAPGSGNRGIGFDPSYEGPAEDLNGRLVFQRRFYDDQCADLAADVVVCRHVIEHVAAPMMLLHSVRAALARSPMARVFFETPCVEWILKHRVVWDFFYEHCSLFSADSMRGAFERAGFTVQGVDHVFGEQYLWLEAAVGDATRSANDSAETIRLAGDYAAAEPQLLRGWAERLASLAAAGKVALWGAGAKGATFANLIDPERRHVDCVVDLNPKKQGRCIPGTGHQIVAPTALPGRGVKNAVLMNPNYYDENVKLLGAAGIDVELIVWSD